jgi:hypothetical protein
MSITELLAGMRDKDLPPQPFNGTGHVRALTAPWERAGCEDCETEDGVYRLASREVPFYRSGNCADLKLVCIEHTDRYQD